MRGLSTGWFVVNLCWASPTILRNPIAIIVYFSKLYFPKRIFERLGTGWFVVNLWWASPTILRNPIAVIGF